MNYSTISRLPQIQRTALIATLWLLMGLPAFAQSILAPAKQWDKRFGGTGHDDSFTQIIPTNDGGYLLSGTSNSPLSGDISQSSKGSGDFWVVKVSSNGNKIWDRRYGGDGWDGLRAAVACPDGGFLLVGFTASEVSGDVSEPPRSLNGRDGWIICISANGTKLWDKRFGGSDEDELNSATATADGGFLLAGYTRSPASGDVSEPIKVNTYWQADYWAVKISANGTKQWDKRYGGGQYDYCDVVTATSDGGYLLTGRAYSIQGGDVSQPPRGFYDAWVVKISANGNKQWDQRYGGKDSDDIHSVVPTPDGGFLLGGSTNSPVSGEVSQAPKGHSDMWLVKISANGTKQWDKRYGGVAESSSTIKQIVATSDGAYLLAGISNSSIGNDKTEANRGEMDFWAVKINSNGTNLWDKTFGGNERDDCYGVAQTTDGGFLLAGYSNSPVSYEKSQPSWGKTDVLNGIPYYDYLLVKTEAEQPFRYQYLMSNTAVTACSGSFYDSGFTGYYANNSFFTKTFTPATAGYRVQISFEDFETEATYDQLSIYNGPSTSSPLIGTYSGKNSPGIITATNPTGQLTFKFSSDYSVTKQGWRAKLTCLVSIAHGRLANAEEAREAEPSTQLKVSPNPFTDQATLSFQLPQTQAVRLLVYDSQGREVRTLFDGQAQADVPYTFDFSGQGRAPGLYIARLLTNSGTHQQKLILGR